MRADLLRSSTSDAVAWAVRKLHTSSRPRLAGWLALVMLAAVDAVGGERRLSVGDVAGQPGLTLALPVEISSYDELVAAQFEILYDASVLSLGEVVTGPALAGHVVASREISPGVRRVVVYSRAGQPLRNGVAVNLLITVSATAPDAVSTVSLRNAVAARRDGMSAKPLELGAGRVRIRGGMPPILSDIARAVDGRVEFKLEGTIGREYLIETSTDLTEWAPLERRRVEAGRITIVDAAATAFERRFYRAVLVP